MTLSAPIFRLRRQAKLLARGSNALLHHALDRIAQREGYRSWSYLSGSHPASRPTQRIFAALSPGDLVLLGARPGHGKTLLGLGLALGAAQAECRSFFFSLESSEAAVQARIRSLRGEGAPIPLIADTSDRICARYIADRVQDGRGGSFVVIDYLQILDQKRSNPELDVQVRDLKTLARDTSAIVVALSQIDRAFDPANRPLPQLSDIRLPNPVDLSLFTKACFLHAGTVRLDAVA